MGNCTKRGERSKRGSTVSQNSNSPKRIRITWVTEANSFINDAFVGVLYKNKKSSSLKFTNILNALHAPLALT